MRIAINITRDLVGGITTTNINLINHLIRNDHEFIGIELNPHVYMKGPSIFRSFPPEFFDHHIVNQHDIPFFDVIKKAKTLKDVEKKYTNVIQLIRKILREKKPDVILLSGTYYIPWLMSIAAEKENVPIVLRYAGVLTRETSHSTAKNRKIYHVMEKSIVARAKKIVFPSEICRNVVQEEVVKKKLKNTYVIPNSVAQTFTEHRAPEQSLNRMIAAVGRYSAIKDFDTYFRLHKKLMKENWQHTATYVTSTPANKMKRLPKTIKLMPPMNPEGLKRFYLTQGLIISPSTFETFGNVPMEAVCLGIPVLVNKTLGCAEILKQAGLENMVVDFTDETEVIKKIKDLCGQNILPKQLNALHKILDHRLIGDEIEAVLLSMNGK